MAKKIGRVELLMWLNELLQLTYVQVEQAGTGAAYCQILDSIYGDVPLSKVKFNASLEHEYISNFKILQQSFNKHKIKHEIPIEKLIKKRFTDNYDFLCWMKQYWEDNYQGEAYNAQERRELFSRSSSRMMSPRTGAGITSISNGPYGRSSTLSPRNSSGQTNPRNFASPNQSNLANAILVQRTNNINAELRRDAQRLIKERDYYYTKLREIEALYNAFLASDPTPEVVLVLKELQKILFSQETASQRLLQSPTLSNNLSLEEIPDTLPNMLSTLSLDDIPFNDSSEVDETDTF